MESGIEEKFACGIQNPGLWNPEYSSRNPESHKRLETRIQVPMTKTGIHYLESRIQFFKISEFALFQTLSPKIALIPYRSNCEMLIIFSGVEF